MDEFPEQGTHIAAEAMEELEQSIGADGAAEVIEAYIEWAVAIAGRAIPDAEALGRAAHALRSSARMLGLRSLADFCEEIDAALKRGDAVDVAAGVVHIRALVAEALPFLRSNLARLQPAVPSGGAATAEQ
ncbi:MAG: Hpt domain-containing protein [Nevskia sp.]|nr:Hpt domain-containing protein [Nevskia sp.]